MEQNDTMAVAQSGSHLTLHYRIALKDGPALVNTFGGQPATLALGEGQIVPTLEQLMMGMSAGEHRTFSLTADEAFGPRNSELVQQFSLKDLKENGVTDEDLRVGHMLAINTPEGGRYVGVLKTIEATWAAIDFNHPLAGQPIIFEVQLIAVL